jgi:hypothetical protein
LIASRGEERAAHLYVDTKKDRAGLLDAVFDNLFDAVAVVDGETGRNCQSYSAHNPSALKKSDKSTT